MDPTNEVMNHPELRMHVNPAFVTEDGENLLNNANIGGGADFEVHQIQEYLTKAKDIDWSQDYNEFIIKRNLSLGQLEGFVSTQRKIGLSTTMDYQKFDHRGLNEKQGKSWKVLTSWSKAAHDAEKHGTDPPKPILMIVKGNFEK